MNASCAADGIDPTVPIAIAGVAAVLWTGVLIVRTLNAERPIGQQLIFALGALSTAFTAPLIFSFIASETWRHIVGYVFFAVFALGYIRVAFMLYRFRNLPIHLFTAGCRGYVRRIRAAGYTWVFLGNAIDCGAILIMAIWPTAIVIDSVCVGLMFVAIQISSTPLVVAPEKDSA